MSRTLALIVSMAACLTGGIARADDECIPLSGAQASVDKFLDETAAAHKVGQGTLPIADVLIGVTEIGAEDQQALDARELVQMTASDANGGDYVSRGPKRVTVEGLFADRDTLFRIPKLVMGRYVLGPDSVTLLYDPEHTVEVGERVVGIRFFLALNHTVFTQSRLSFFFDDNDGAEPDRCYDILN